MTDLIADISRWVGRALLVLAGLLAAISVIVALGAGTQFGSQIVALAIGASGLLVATTLAAAGAGAYCVGELLDAVMAMRMRLDEIDHRLRGVEAAPPVLERIARATEVLAATVRKPQ